MSPRRRPSRLVAASERIYRRIVYLYPKRFRSDYAALMEQLFRDQCRDACHKNAPIGVAKLWWHVIADTATSACREHVSELQKIMNATISKHFLRRPRLTSAKVFAVTCVLLLSAVSALVAFWLPTLYRSTVRIAVELPASSTVASDPYFFQTETEKITSRLVLNQVIKELGLTSRRAQEAERTTPLTNEESYQRLKRAVFVRQSRNTSLLEVGVLDENRATAAQIANAVADVYRRNAKSATRPLVVEVVDGAEPGIRPVRPNVPMSLTMGWLGSVIVAALVALVTRRWLPTNRRAES